MEKVRLWTRQDKRMLDVLQKEGVFHVKREYIEEKNEDLTPYYIKLYDWFVQAASKRVPHPPGAGYPIWCSISEEYMLRGIAGNILIHLEVDADRIVYFDSSRWDIVLNHMYLPEDEADHNAFMKYIQSRGITNEFTLLDEHHTRFYPDLRQRVISSWDRIFDIKNWNMFTVQANIWEIRPEDILKIEHFE